MPTLPTAASLSGGNNPDISSATSYVALGNKWTDWNNITDKTSWQAQKAVDEFVTLLETCWAEKNVGAP